MHYWMLNALLFLSLATPVSGQTLSEPPTSQPLSVQPADDGCAHIATVIQAEPGDSFTALFGEAWEPVAACNRYAIVRNGEVIASPDLLVAGSWIRIPEGTPLTPPVAARAGELNQRRWALLDRMNHLPMDRLDSDGRALAGRCRALLSDKLRFAPDEQFATRELVYLEELAAHPAPSPVAQRLVVTAVSIAAMLLLLAVALVVRMYRPASATLLRRQSRAQMELARACTRAGISFDT